MNQLTSQIVHSLFLNNQNKNWVFSPASYLEAMSNLALCLKDKNLSELLDAAPDIQRPHTIGLESYNCLLYSAEYREALNQSVLEALTAKNADLKSFEGLEAVAIVNDFVREKTRGKIDGLITESDIDEMTKFIILNCIHFKGAWLYSFRDSWRLESFRNATTTAEIKYLCQYNIATRYYEGAGYDIVELPYKESDICCYLIVPTTASLFELFHKKEDVFGHIIDVKRDLNVDLKVPSFKINSTFNLQESTQIAGVKNIFNYNKDWTLVDFNKLKDEAVLRVSKIIQKTYFEFAKDGVEAAAATAIIIGITGCCSPRFFEPPRVKTIWANSPFVFVLQKSESSNPLFVGVINEAKA